MKHYGNRGKRSERGHGEDFGFYSEGERDHGRAVCQGGAPADLCFHGITLVGVGMDTLRGVQPAAPPGCTWPRMVMNAEQHNIVNVLKTFFFFFLLISFC